MTGEATASDIARLLAEDLASIQGALAEIATTWRRASQSRPDLPLGDPALLQDAVGELAANIRRAAGADLDPADVASRLRVLKDDIAAARALTCGPGMPPAGDAALWGALGDAMRQADSRLAGLTAG